MSAELSEEEMRQALFGSSIQLRHHPRPELPPSNLRQPTIRESLVTSHNRNYHLINALHLDVDPPDLLAFIVLLARHIIPEPKAFVLVINIVLGHVVILLRRPHRSTLVSWAVAPSSLIAAVTLLVLSEGIQVSSQ